MMAGRAIIAAMFVVLCACATGEPLTTYTARLEFRTDLPSWYVGYNEPDSEVQFKREPPLGRRTMRTRIDGRGAFYDFAWDRDAGLLYADTDADLDLTDETPVALSDTEESSATLLFRPIGNLPAALSILLTQNKYFLLRKTSGWAGPINLADQEWLAVYRPDLQTSDSLSGSLSLLTPESDPRDPRVYCGREIAESQPVFVARGDTGRMYKPSCVIADGGPTPTLELRMAETSCALTTLELKTPQLSHLHYNSSTAAVGGIIDAPSERLLIGYDKPQPEGSSETSPVYRGRLSFILYADDPVDSRPLYRSYVAQSFNSDETIHIQAGGTLHNEVAFWRLGRELRIGCMTRDAWRNTWVDVMETTKPQVVISVGRRQFVDTALEYG